MFCFETMPPGNRAAHPVEVVDVDVYEDPVEARQDLLADRLERSRKRDVRRHREDGLVVDLRSTLPF
jgi:hypothetical protein